MIQLAACVRSRFNLEMLADVAEKPLAEVTQHLWPALRDGLLLQDGGEWHLGMMQNASTSSNMPSSERTVASQFSLVSLQCRFLHDRMLQAAYQSLSTEKRQQFHLRVGRLLLKDQSIDNLSNDECFVIVEQLNNAGPLIENVGEQYSLMRLNLRAAQQAKASSVWEAATDYADKGIQLLPGEHWSVHYVQTRDLYLIKAECEYLNGHPEASEPAYDILFDKLLQAEICATRLVQCIGRGQWGLGMELGKQGLSYLGMSIPSNDQLEEALQEEKKFLHEHSENDVLDVFELPEMVDPRKLMAVRIYPNLYAASTVSGQLEISEYCIYKGCNLILKAGKSDLAAIQLTYYSACLARQRQLKKGVFQGVLARKLADSYVFCREIANCYNVLGGWIWYLQAPYQNSVELCMQGMQLGVENGELARSAISYCNALFAKCSQGEPLIKLREDAQQAEVYVNKMSVFHPVQVLLENLAKHCLKLQSSLWKC